MSRLVRMSSLKYVMFKVNYCPHLPILNLNIIIYDLLPPPTAKDVHRIVTIILISISVWTI